MLYVGAEVLNPRGTDQVVTTATAAFKLLPSAVAESSQLYLSGSLSVLALEGLAVSYAAIAAPVTGRRWAVATVGAPAAVTSPDTADVPLIHHSRELT